MADAKPTEEKFDHANPMKSDSVGAAAPVEKPQSKPKGGDSSNKKPKEDDTDRTRMFGCAWWCWLAIGGVILVGVIVGVVVGLTAGSDDGNGDSAGTLSSDDLATRLCNPQRANFLERFGATELTEVTIGFENVS